MNQKELKELIEFLKEQDIAEFELERGDVKVRIKRAVPATAAETRFIPIPTVTQVSPEAISAAVMPAAAPPGAPAESLPSKPEEPLHSVRSPIVGTFYESPSPGAPPFAKVGDTVEVGQVLCIVEAMKLMNEIESDVSGEIVKKFVSNGQPIEYGQELFAIRAK
ncbi:MAG TPA: acetyl-CoA carboxylase biotin carboxyl carrier protein [Terriglobales bacterium]